LRLHSVSLICLYSYYTGIYNFVKILLIKCARIVGKATQLLKFHLMVNTTKSTAKLITPDEAAQLKSVTRAAIYAAIAEGRLPATRILGRLALKRKDVVAWVPRSYAGRPGRKSGPPVGIRLSEEAKQRISEGQKRRWQQRKQITLKVGNNGRA